MGCLGAVNYDRPYEGSDMIARKSQTSLKNPTVGQLLAAVAAGLYTISPAERKGFGMLPKSAVVYGTFPLGRCPRSEGAKLNGILTPVAQAENNLLAAHITGGDVEAAKLSLAEKVANHTRPVSEKTGTSRGKAKSAGECAFCGKPYRKGDMVEEDFVTVHATCAAAADEADQNDSEGRFNFKGGR